MAEPSFARAMRAGDSVNRSMLEDRSQRVGTYGGSGRYKNMFSMKKYTKTYILATNMTVWDTFTMPNRNVYDSVDILGQQSWPDIIITWSKLWNHVPVLYGTAYPKRIMAFVLTWSKTNYNRAYHIVTKLQQIYSAYFHRNWDNPGSPPCYQIVCPSDEWWHDLDHSDVDRQPSSLSPPPNHALLCEFLLSNCTNTRFNGLLKIVTMSGQCVICWVNVPDLGYNWTSFYILAAVTTGCGTNSAHLQLNNQGCW